MGPKHSPRANFPMKPNRHTKPAPRNLPDAMKLQIVTDKLRDVIVALGIETDGKSLHDLTSEAVSRAKVAKVISEQMASCQAYIDGALDAIGYGKPDDLRRAKLSLEKAQKNLVISFACIQADAQRADAAVKAKAGG